MLYEHVYTSKRNITILFVPCQGSNLTSSHKAGVQRAKPPAGAWGTLSGGQVIPSQLLSPLCSPPKEASYDWMSVKPLTSTYSLPSARPASGFYVCLCAEVAGPGAARTSHFRTQT